MLSSAIASSPRHDIGSSVLAEEVGVATLYREVGLDWHAMADRGYGGDLAVFASKTGKSPDSQASRRHPDRVARSRAPAKRARDEDVQVSGPVELHSPLDLGFGIMEIGDRRCGDMVNAMGHGETGKIFALSENIARFTADGLSRRRASCWWCGPGSLHAGIHVGLVVVADEQYVVVALEHSRETTEPDVDRPSVTGLGHYPHIVVSFHLECGRHPGCHRWGVAEE